MDIPTNARRATASHVIRSTAGKPRDDAGQSARWAVHVALSLLVLGLCSGHRATAETGVICDTPVYRYAMYRWKPADYELYLIGSANGRDSLNELRNQVQALEKEADAPNLFVVEVDTSRDPKLLSVAPAIREAWFGLNGSLDEGVVLAAPGGTPVFAGSCDTARLLAWLDCPIRQSIAQRLAAGDPCVFVLQAGTDQGANLHAIETIRDFLAELPPPPADEFEMPPIEAGADEVHLVVVDSHHASEDESSHQWLAGMLSATHDDKTVDSQSPLVYAVYGRGRVSQPVPAAQIDRQQLHDLLDFVRGPCACIIKEQNPGADLLFRTDWEAAAKRLLDRFGQEEGNESFAEGEGDFFPQLLVGVDPDQAASPDPANNDPPAEASITERPQAPTDDSTLSSNELGSAVDDNRPAAVPADAHPDDMDSRQSSSHADPAENGPTGGPFRFSATMIVGGLIVAAIFVVGLTAFLVRMV